jgi:hypothetical protein
MTDRQPGLDLRALEHSYEIVGELRGAPDTHPFVARRRDDAADVMITVVNAPPDDDNNALAHLASDTQLLTNVSHPSVPRVHGGQWLGADAYAVITDQVHGTPLAELVSRGERIANARVSVVLQEVDGVLDWARSQGIVHRKVTPETLWFEPGTDRVVISFAAARVPMSGVPDARGDARTIGTLAWSMLAGRRYDDRDDSANPPLREAAPDLAARVVDATEQMIRAESEEEVPDVPGFLALIASGDVLRRAEVEMEALQTDFTERHRIVLEKYENERSEIEAAAAEHAARLAADRAAFERLVNERQEQLALVRAELNKQRKEIARRLAELDERRAVVEKAELERARRGTTRYVRDADDDVDSPPDVHWSIPVSFAAVLILLLAGLVATLSHQRRPAMSAGEVIAPRSAPAIGRPAIQRSPAVQPHSSLSTPVAPPVDTLRRDTTRRDTATYQSNRL